jgi:hypothetical protein
MGRKCSTNGEKRNAYMILVRTPKGKRPLGRPAVWIKLNKMVSLKLVLYDAVNRNKVSIR